MMFLPSVIPAEYRGGFRIYLTFNDLSQRTVDFRPWLEGPVFEALKDARLLPGILCGRRHVTLAEWGDIASETFYVAATSLRAFGERAQLATARVKPVKARAHH